MIFVGYNMEISQPFYCGILNMSKGHRNYEQNICSVVFMRITFTKAFCCNTYLPLWNYTQQQILESILISRLGHKVGYRWISMTLFVKDARYTQWHSRLQTSPKMISLLFGRPKKSLGCPEVRNLILK